MSLWNYTIDDASPYLTYSPYSDGPSTASGWRTWYTGSHYISSPDQVSQGDSYHITSLRNASATFQFFGTGVALYGFTNSSFNIIIDNEPSITVNASDSSSKSKLLFASQNLSNKLHTVTFSAQPSPVANLTQNLAFDSAVTSTPLDNDEVSPSAVFYDSTNSESFIYLGSWTPRTQSGVPNATVTAPFYQTTQVNASVSFSFSGAKAVVVKGLSSSENGLYSVSLDGQTSIFNGTSLWTIPDALLFLRAGLDPNTTHKLTIVNLSSRFCLNSITVYEHESRNITPDPLGGTQPPHHSSSRSIRVIVGPVAGCVLFIMAITLLLWFRRRYRSNQHHFTIPGLKSKLPFSKPSRTPRQPSHGALISPMLATLNQEDRSVTFDVLSTSTNTTSDIRSSTRPLMASANYADRSIHSVMSSSPAHSQISQHIVQDPFGSWEPQRDIYVPSLPSQAVSTSGHRSGPSQSSLSQMSAGTQQSSTRLTEQTSYSSMSEFGSPRRHAQTPASDNMRKPSRGPLPPIPIPSYDAALRDPQPTPDEVREIESLQLSESSRYRRRLSTYTSITSITAITAPPQYEQ